jgi:hypothetical protein
MAWLKKSKLPDGQLACFYELQTNAALLHEGLRADVRRFRHRRTTASKSAAAAGSDATEYEKLARKARRRRSSRSASVKFTSGVAAEATKSPGPTSAGGRAGKLKNYSDDDSRAASLRATFILNVRTLARCAAAK